jgi:hypothetical protein
MQEKIVELAKQARRRRPPPGAWVAGSFAIVARSLYEALSSSEQSITMSEARQAVEVLAKLLDVLRQLDSNAVDTAESTRFFERLIEELTSDSESAAQS